MAKLMYAAIASLDGYAEDEQTGSTAPNATDLDPRRGSMLIRRGKGNRRREVGMDLVTGVAGAAHKRQRRGSLRLLDQSSGLLGGRIVIPSAEGETSDGDRAAAAR